MCPETGKSSRITRARRPWNCFSGLGVQALSRVEGLGLMGQCFSVWGLGSVHKKSTPDSRGCPYQKRLPAFFSVLCHYMLFMIFSTITIVNTAFIRTVATIAIIANITTMVIAIVTTISASKLLTAHAFSPCRAGRLSQYT